MQSRFRLTRSEDFKRVRQTGKSYAHPLVVLVTLPNLAQRLRVGVTAGRTVGTAVHRNRAKRLLREALRPLLPTLASNWDLILVARPKLVAASLAETREAVTALLNRAKLI
ncbi:MAG: ribonuclease P protein component [Anaerolineales bacterium]|nr:ribonuclease P protein component [Anaerolineales bacterium]